MRATATLVIATVLVVLALFALGSREEARIYDRGVFLTVGVPDVPSSALAVFQRLRPVHDLEDLQALLRAGTKVIVYDCSASNLLGQGFLENQLPVSFSVLAINVSSRNILHPRGCEPAAQGGTYLTFYRQCLAGETSGFGSGIARFSEGSLYLGFLQRELRQSPFCGSA